MFSLDQEEDEVVGLFLQNDAEETDASMTDCDFFTDTDWETQDFYSYGEELENRGFVEDLPRHWEEDTYTFIAQVNENEIVILADQKVDGQKPW